MRISIEEVQEWANQNGIKFNPKNLPEEIFLNGEFEISSCLPSSEQDELKEMLSNPEFKNLTESQWSEKVFEIFDRHDFSTQQIVKGMLKYRPISGFCNSIVDRVVLGKFMAVNSIKYAELIWGENNGI